MPFLNVHDITKTFLIGEQNLTVLHGITMEVKKGEFLALTGKSGSGKSTLMNILGCLDVPTTGSYFFQKQDISKLSPDQLAHIRNKQVGFVFQQFNLLPDLTALDNTALPCLYSGMKEKEAQDNAKKVLALVGLDDRLHHYPTQLSGGQQQRVSIARALVNKPILILADEPTGNLDSKTGNRVMDVFRHLNKTQQITVILVTHDLDLASTTKRIITLVDGQIETDRLT
ncbi:ABC transporter ATP-binding protein [Candidatus Dependentiae bacterium]|nr:ABC transporter ATP-binding protein [Candidatus Dependentiae bacterium]